MRLGRTAARAASACLLATGLQGCGAPPGPASRTNVDTATPASVGATERLLHVAGRLDLQALRVRARAPATQTLLINNCNGDPGWRLHRLDGAGWTEIWSGESDACASAPIRIDAGTARTFVLDRYNGGRAPLEPGRYRLSLHGIRWATPTAEGTDDAPVEPALRVSNVFELKRPAD